MNDYGKFSVSILGQELAFLLFVLVVTPFLKSRDFVFPTTNLTPLEFSELAFWSVYFFFIVGLFWVAGHIISGFCCYTVYFIQRAWYLYKLRKPERVYTGDPL